MSVSKKETKSLYNLLSPYLVQWKWLALFGVASLAAAYLYLSLQIPIYSSTASIFIKENSKRSSSTDELALFRDLGIPSSGINSLQNEIELMKSSAVIAEVIKDLRLQVKTFAISNKTNYKQIELYENNPFDIIFTNGDSSLYDSYLNVKIEVFDALSFGLMDKEDNITDTILFGKPFNKGTHELILKNKANDFIGWNTREFKIETKPIKNATQEYKNRLSINLLRKDVSILILNCKGPSVEQNNDFLTKLIEFRQQKSISDKSRVSKSTSDFINDRIEIISRELSGVEEDDEEFKTSRGLINIAQDASSIKEKETEIEFRLIDLNVQERIITYMKNFLIELKSEETLLPTNLGLEDASINATINTYNDLVLEKIKLTSVTSNLNPSVVQIKTRLNELKRNLINSFDNILKSIKIRIDDLKERQKVYEKEIAKVPRHEREYREIIRQKQIKESLYLYLLQKREENEIASAVNLSDISIIEEAFGYKRPISPSSSSTYVKFLLFGLAIPIALIYLIGLFDNKVKKPEEIQNLDLPYLGNLPMSKKKDKLVSTKNSHSPVSEALRILRTNMNFIMSDEHKGGKIIMVTSTVPGEGKSFVSINLAHSIAQTDKKTVLVGMDLRAPKLSEYLTINARGGVSNYIINPTIAVNELIEKSEHYDNLYYIVSGPIPPNPSELLLKTRVANLFEELRKEFDYIIVDTAPIGMVVDTMLISKYSDFLLYVVRYNYLNKNALSIPQEFYKNNKLKNLGVVLNGVDFKKEKYGQGYGYGYGYGYGAENSKSSPWWKRKS